MSATDARLRHYLEQMMMVFLFSRVPVAEAAEHLAEVESHCIEAGGETPADPFEQFGDPQDLARQLRGPQRQSRLVATLIVWVLVYPFGLIFAGGLMSLTGDTSVTTLELQIASAFFVLLHASIGLFGEERGIRLVRALVVGLVVGIALIVASLDSVFPGGIIAIRRSLFVPAALVVVPAFLVGSWLYNRPSQIRTPVPVGITADIVEDLGQPGVLKDWIHYDMNGEPVSETVREELRKGAAEYRSIGYEFRRWAADAPDANEADFVPLRHVGAQALALLAFVAFAGFALAVSPSDTMQSVGKWLIFLAPFAGVWLLIRNFSQRRPN